MKGRRPVVGDGWRKRGERCGRGGEREEVRGMMVVGDTKGERLREKAWCSGRMENKVY